MEWKVRNSNKKLRNLGPQWWKAEKIDRAWEKIKTIKQRSLKLKGRIVKIERWNENN